MLFQTAATQAKKSLHAPFAWKGANWTDFPLHNFIDLQRKDAQWSLNVSFKKINITLTSFSDEHMVNIMLSNTCYR